MSMRIQKTHFPSRELRSALTKSKKEKAAQKPKEERFSRATFSLPQALSIAKDLKFIAKEHAKLLKRCEKVPAMRAVRDFQKGKEIKTLMGLQHPVKTAHGEHMYLLSAPKGEDISSLFVTAVLKNASVMVSLCSERESSRILPYWKKEVAEGACLPLDWKITDIKEKVLFAEKGSKSYPERVVERTISVQHDGTKTTLTHLHFENWPDHQPVTQHKALDILATRIDELTQDPKRPLIINCRGGRGRTGSIALIHCSRRKIRSELNAGKKLDDIKLNLSENLYEIKKKRPRVGGENPAQLAQVYEAIGRYYLELKESAKSAAF